MTSKENKMSYGKLEKICNVREENLRLTLHARYLLETPVSGLYYLNFISRSNTLTISNPDSSTNHLATCFLIDRLGYRSVNSVRNNGAAIKKFLDFLMVWNVDVKKCSDFMVLLIGFVDYLKLISNTRPIHSFQWALCDRVPLNEEASNLGKVISVVTDDYGLKRAPKGEFSVKSIKSVITAVCLFLEFIKKRTNVYRDIDLSSIPVKIIKKDNLISGTYRRSNLIVFDCDGIIRLANMKDNTTGKRIKPISGNSIFTTEELNSFLSYLNNKNPLSKLLFTVLKCFGIRRGEAANLIIDWDSIPKDLFRKGYSNARQEIRENLKGDIRFDRNLNTWFLEVRKRHGKQPHDSQHKSRDRTIPLQLISEEQFCEILLNGILVRQGVMKYLSLEEQHSYLFVSMSNKTKGKRMTGSSIGSSFHYYTEKFREETAVDITRFSPHTFRHYFATHLIRNKKIPIWDVKRLLGHSHIAVTEGIYLHFLPKPDEPEFKAIDMIDTFRNQIEKKTNRKAKL